MRSLSIPSNGPMVDPYGELAHSDFFGGDKSILEKFKKSEAAFSSICKNEPNLSMLTSKISSILEQGMIKQRKNKALGSAGSRKGCQLDEMMRQPMMPHQSQQQHQQQTNDYGGSTAQQQALMGMTRTQDDL